MIKSCEFRHTMSKIIKYLPGGKKESNHSAWLHFRLKADDKLWLGLLFCCGLYGRHLSNAWPVFCCTQWLKSCGTVLRESCSAGWNRRGVRSEGSAITVTRHWLGAPHLAPLPHTPQYVNVCFCSLAMMDSWSPFLMDSQSARDPGRVTTAGLGTSTDAPNVSFHIFDRAVPEYTTFEISQTYRARDTQLMVSPWTLKIKHGC